MPRDRPNNNCRSFAGSAALRFTCGKNGVSRLSEIAGEPSKTSLTIGSNQASLEVDVSKLRLPPGEHQLVQVKVDRLQGQFARAEVTETDTAAIARAVIQYDEESGEIRLRCIVGESAE